MAGKAATAEVPEVVERALGEGAFSVEKFVESFPALVEATGGIDFLRSFVLDLAIRGSLGTRDPKDEPASLLLARMGGSRPRGSHRRPQGDSQRALPFSLPESWAWTELAEIWRIVTDGDHQPPPKTDSGVPFLTIGNVSGGKIDFTDTRFVSRTYFDSLDPDRVPSRGDLLYTVVGSFGIPVMVDTNKEFCIQRHIAILKPLKETNVAFMGHLMRSGFMYRQAAAAVTGIAQPTLGLGQLRRLLVPVPPLAEQKRIVARVDQLMALIDQLEAKQNRKRDLGARFTKASLEALGAATEPAAFDSAWKLLLQNWESVLIPSTSVADLRQACLDLAFRGRLTAPQGRSFRPRTGADLAVDEGQNSSGRDATSAVVPGRIALAVGAASISLPEDWRWVPLMAVARLESGHTPSRSHPEYWNGGIHWIGIQDARDHHKREITATRQNVSKAGLANSAARLLPSGTVCLSRTASIGYVTVMGREMATSQDFVNWVCSDSLLPRYLMWLLVCEKPSLLRFSEGAVHRTIYYPEVKAFHVALPPLAEQKRIVAKVEHLMKLCDALEAALRRREDRAAKLAEAVVQEMVA